MTFEYFVRIAASKEAREDLNMSPVLLQGHFAPGIAFLGPRMPMVESSLDYGNKEMGYNILKKFILYNST